MIQNDSKPETDEKRLVSVVQLQTMRKRAFRLIDHFTEVSGHAQIALAKGPAGSTRAELEKILSVAEKAVNGLRACVREVNEIEKSSSE